MIDTIIKLEHSLNKTLKDIRESKNLEDLKSYLSIDPILTTTETGSLTIRISLDLCSSLLRHRGVRHCVLIFLSAQKYIYFSNPNGFLLLKVS